MIGWLQGTVLRREATRVVVDVGGVGYLVHVSASESLPARGQTVELHTSLQVREDSLTLYGFGERAALTLFELLLSSSGVGPRLALGALGTHAPDTLRTAIAAGDVDTLTMIPGVGRKVADRLVLELREKVGAVVTVPGTGAALADSDAVQDVREALVGLGYSATEIEAALREGAGELEGTDPGEAAPDAATLLRTVLRHLGASPPVGGAT